MNRNAVSQSQSAIGPEGRAIGRASDIMPTTVLTRRSFVLAHDITVICGASIAKDICDRLAASLRPMTLLIAFVVVYLARPSRIPQRAASSTVAG